MRRLTGLTFVLFAVLAASALALVGTTLQDFFLPGSQPLQSGNLETPDKCDNCHGGYNLAVEPAYNWRGSMMAQAARDPFFYACMAVCNQDAAEVGDLCIRCHSPAGWLEGRSVPTDGSALNNNDRQGVQCDFCHKLVRPTSIGTNPYPGDAAYTSGTYAQDQGYLSILTNIPGTSANGMYVCDSNNAKRGPYTDAVARHQVFYSPFHREAALCGTCHDVSNPAFSKNSAGNYMPNDLNQPAPDFNPRALFPVERTYSEWLMSAYNTPQGIYAPQFGGNKQYVSTCQDCHMKDVTGVGCNKAGAPVRTDLPRHDMTGGNTTIPRMVATLFPAEINTAALDAGVQRAAGMLAKAATLSATATQQADGYLVQARVTNQTAHKLLSGYPEGRRMWLNVKAYNGTGGVIYESGAYDFNTGVLTHDADAKIYEIKPGISAEWAAIVGLPAGPSFHFVLNNMIYSDNRIPPRGFTNANFETIQSPPVGYTYADGQYWDDTSYLVPLNTAEVIVTLYYQATSKEYVEFLRDENVTNTWGQTLYDLWVSGGRSAPVAMVSQRLQVGTIVDTQPPTAPTNLTATAASSSQINLAWTASTDNVGVAGYYVFRGGVQIGTALGTTYQDNGLQPVTTYSYFVKAFDAAGNVSAQSNTASATTKKKTGRAIRTDRDIDGLSVTAWPNPFGESTQFMYSLDTGASVKLDVFDATGRCVANIVDAVQPAGRYQVSWTPGGVAGGLYFVRLSTGDRSITEKVLLAK